MKLGKLKKIPLREYWKHEALDFTKWLSEPENIELLSDEIGIGIEDVQTEANAGSFKVDILAKESQTDRTIIIENQLEKTDHSHLGQLITYAAGLEAKYVIWIVSEARDEHRQAVDWLNEHTDEDINFFLIVIELWQIEDSPPAPKFSVISSPNEWTKIVRASSQGELTETKLKQLDFWQQLKDFAQENFSVLKFPKPLPQSYRYIALGRSDRGVYLYVSPEDIVRCELWIFNQKDLYYSLYESKDQIEKELGIKEPIEWLELPGKKASRIVTSHKFTFTDTSSWNEAFKWLCETTIKFKNVFSKDW